MESENKDYLTIVEASKILGIRYESAFHKAKRRGLLVVREEKIIQEKIKNLQCILKKDLDKLRENFKTSEEKKLQKELEDLFQENKKLKEELRQIKEENKKLKEKK